MWVLLAVTAVLAVLVGTLARRVHRLEQQLNRAVTAPSPSSDPHGTFSTVDNMPRGSLDGERDAAAPQYVITQLGEDVAAEPEPEPVEVTVPAGQFADVLLRESVVKVGSFMAGLRRALSPEVRNRIRFEMRREVKRSRRQRRQDTKRAYREWTARQRAAMAAEDGQAA